MRGTIGASLLTPQVWGMAGVADWGFNHRHVKSRLGLTSRSLLREEHRALGINTVARHRRKGSTGAGAGDGTLDWEGWDARGRRIQRGNGLGCTRYIHPLVVAADPQ